MKLVDPWFEAEFIRYTSATSLRYQREDGTPYTLAEANGVQFWCPCGPHMVQVPFAGRDVPDGAGPLSRDGKTHPRWSVSGTGLQDLTLTPSIDVGHDSCWHGYITNGEVR